MSYVMHLIFVPFHTKPSIKTCNNYRITRSIDIQSMELDSDSKAVPRISSSLPPQNCVEVGTWGFDKDALPNVFWRSAPIDSREIPL